MTCQNKLTTRSLLQLFWSFQLNRTVFLSKGADISIFQTTMQGKQCTDYRIILIITHDPLEMCDGVCICREPSACNFLLCCSLWNDSRHQRKWDSAITFLSPESGLDLYSNQQILYSITLRTSRPRCLKKLRFKVSVSFTLETGQNTFCIYYIYQVDNMLFM